MPKKPGEKINPKNKTVNADGTNQYYWEDGTPVTPEELNYENTKKPKLVKNPDGTNRFVWPDGTELTPEEFNALSEKDRIEAGLTGPKGTADDPRPVVYGYSDNPLFNYFNKMVPKQVSADAPGASLDTANADAERQRTEGLLGQLQQQAATGGGEWEKTLAQATQNAQNTAQALGQSNPNAGYQSSLRNIGNAQSAASQRAVGQGNTLRAQAQQDALAKQGDLLSATGEQDIEQARLAGQAKQQRRQTNQQLVSNARKSAENMAGGFAQAFMSDGGQVPGRARVFGDDEKNDTVPAMLSPGEIVVPRSMANDPEAAANFARAVAQNRGVKKMADGGNVETGLESLPGPKEEETALIVGAPHFGIDQYYSRIGGGPQTASIENGGLLDARNFEANRAASLGLMDSLSAPGSSITNQQMTNASDDTIAGAMAQQQQRAAASNSSNALAQAVAQQQQAGGQAAATRGNEESRRQALLAQTATGQRGRDLAMALAQQQAGWRNTAMNAGLSAADQAAVMNAVSGGAQAIGALSKRATKESGEEDPYDLGDEISNERGDDGENAHGSSSDAGDWNIPDGDSQTAAHGGVILDSDEAERQKTAKFLKALKRAA